MINTSDHLHLTFVDSVSTPWFVFQAAELSQLSSSLSVPGMHWFKHWQRPLRSVPDSGPGWGAAERRQAWATFSEAHAVMGTTVNHNWERGWLLRDQRDGPSVEGACVLSGDLENAQEIQSNLSAAEERRGHFRQKHREKYNGRRVWDLKWCKRSQICTGGPELLNSLAIKLWFQRKSRHIEQIKRGLFQLLREKASGEGVA